MGGRANNILRRGWIFEKHTDNDIVGLFWPNNSITR